MGNLVNFILNFSIHEVADCDDKGLGQLVRGLRSAVRLLLMFGATCCYTILRQRQRIWVKMVKSLGTPTWIQQSMVDKILTSSTAQGGGGSFKNRKPIGEVGCCESRMAERSHWRTERCLRSPLFLSLSLAIYLPTHLFSMYLSICWSSYLSLSFSLSSHYLSTYLPIYLSIYLSLSLSFICLSV